MASAIWKHRFDERMFEAVEMPRGAQIIATDVQADEPTMWFTCNPSSPTEIRTFTLLPTGVDDADLDDQTHIGTFLLRGGSLVAHLFEGPIPLSLDAVGPRKAA